MKAKYLSLIFMMLVVLFFNNVEPRDLKTDKKFGISLICGYHDISLDDYKNAKKEVMEKFLPFLAGVTLGVLEASLEEGTRIETGDNVSSSYEITFPEGLFNCGIVGSYNLRKNISLIARFLLTSSNGTDEGRVGLPFTIIRNDGTQMNGVLHSSIKNNWKFDITDIAVGVGYSIDDMLFKNTRDTFLFIVGNYSVNLNEDTRVAHTISIEGLQPSTASESYKEKYSNSKFYSEIWCIGSIYLNKAKTFSLDGAFGYKIVTFDNLDNYKNLDGKYVKFNFSGPIFTLGLSYSF